MDIGCFVDQEALERRGELCWYHVSVLILPELGRIPHDEQPKESAEDIPHLFR
jgi:hypothetical protein